MTEEKKKKGFFKRAFGIKSKDEKLAEEAAARAEAQQKIDAEMAARMAAINAAALKSAREQDDQNDTTVVDTGAAARQEAEDKARAEEQAREDVEAAKRLEAEKRAKALEAERLAAEEAAFAKAEAERVKAESEARAKAEAEEAERHAKEAARIKAEEQAALEKARRQKGKREAAALEAQHALEATQRAEAEAKARAEAAKARIEAEAKAAEARAKELAAAKARAAKAAAEEAAQLELERAKAAAEDQRIAKELAERRAEEAELRAANMEGGFLDRVSQGLSKSTSRMSDSVTTLFNKRKLDDDAIEELQDLLIASDLGVGPAMKVTTRLSEDRFDKQVTDLDIKIALSEVISDVLSPLEKPLVLGTDSPQIILFVGVNGSGKTTTLGKLAKRYTDQGKKVLLAAGDTFRAAAVQQLQVWGERANAPVVSGELGVDASGLVYDAVTRAKRENFDVLMIDTAGRLQNRTELMDELSKIVRVIKKQDPTAPHHCVLVLDATVGQNALSQTEAFLATAGVTGLIMTKLDGTAKGGVLVALSDKYKLPIHAIGIGERVEDLENFSAPVFAAALSGVADAMRDND